MNSTGLFLEKDQLFAGMTAAICVAGKDQPETDEKGEPLLVKALVGGVPSRLKLYPCPGGIIFIPGGQPSLVTGQPLPPAIRASGFELAGVRPEVRFMPTQVFTTADAPTNTEYMVFVNGECLMYKDIGKHRHDDIRVRVTKKNGRLISIDGYEYAWWQREVPLPDGAMLVPISEIGKAA